MPDARALIQSAQVRVLRLFLDGDKVKVEAPHSLDGDTKALIEELRRHKEEIRSVLTTAASIRAQDEDLALIRAWVVKEARGEDGELRAVLICSALLEVHLWMILDRSFEPKDNLAVYFREEIPLLKGKSMEDLKLIQETKLIFPGARVVQ
ncbi:MAG: hypothetical protein O7G28_05375 [Deltaproteobacteria bacterium]|nr:hypothetical protein [Deltaproteobacteria bacterium]